MKLIILAMCLFALMSCNTIRDEKITSQSDLPDTEGFYTSRSGNFVLRYKAVNDDRLECILSTPTEGWLAVGFAPSQQMRDANFIISYVTNDIANIRDDWGTSPTTHASDLSLGGSSDVTLISGMESGGITTVRFSIPLDSGDTKDRVLDIGSTYTVIFAQGESDDFSSYHTDAGYATITIRGD